MSDVLVPFRLPRSVTTRLQRLIPLLNADPEYAVVTRITRSSALRLALLRGVQKLEEDYPPHDEGWSPSPSEGGKPRRKTYGKDTEQISVRLPAFLVERAGYLACCIDQDPEWSLSGHVSRSALLRIALAAGIRSLERIYLPEDQQLGPFAGIELYGGDEDESKQMNT